MVEVLDPVATDRICDPACGTAGFLSVAYEFMLQKYSSAAGTHSETIINEKGEAETQTLYSGDLLAQHRHHVDTDMFHGFDFDATMLRIAAMNLVMHGVAEPDIHYQDTLSQRFTENHPNAAKEGFDIVLANPPFKGSLDEEDVAPELLRMVKTKKTELLFVALILRMLKIGGRAAVIVPDGVLFGSSNAHQQLREELIERNQLEAIISLPSGVFKPYAGVSTAIIVFTKGGQTERVMFYDLAADGFSLDDKRTPIANNDLPDAINQWRAYQQLVVNNANSEAIEQQFGDKTQKAFVVDKADIASQKYDLSINRYKEVEYLEESYAPPREILRELKALEEANFGGFGRVGGDAVNNSVIKTDAKI
jgi:type I restriction enzyme M protein